MPLYTAITQEGTVSGETKAKIAEEITRIHTIVMKVPKNFVRVVFLSYPKGFGFTGGEQAPTASLNCVLRSGHTLEEKNRYAATTPFTFGRRSQQSRSSMMIEPPSRSAYFRGEGCHFAMSLAAVPTT